MPSRWIAIVRGYSNKQLRTLQLAKKGYRRHEEMRLSHIGWNLAGLTLPLVAAALTVPRLIEVLGHERFGLLALAWGLIGYAGTFDLGIGRALTKTVSQLRALGDEEGVPDALQTAGRITLMSGVVGGLLILLLGLAGAGEWMRTTETSSTEIDNAIFLLAVALPAQAMSSTYRGLNEAYLNFKGISLLRVGLGAVNFGGPFLVALYTTDLPWLVSTLVASRLIALFVYRSLAHSCLRAAMPTGSHGGRYSAAIARSLFTFGGWVTVSSIVSPLLTQADRFFIAALLSTTAVSAYVLPYEVVVQSLVVVGAITTAIFPILAGLLRREPENWAGYFRKWLRLVAGTMTIVSATIAVMLPYVLTTWIGPALQPDSIMIGQVLCAGVLANSVGAMFYALLHARGRADLTAKLHIVELPLFAFGLFFALETFGLIGAAYAWVGRMVFDAIALSAINRVLSRRCK